MTLAVGIRRPGKVILAADRLTTVDGSAPIVSRKIFREFGMTWAFAGDVCNERVLRSLDLVDCAKRDDCEDNFDDWFMANVAEHAKRFRGDFELLAARPGELWYVGTDLLPYEIGLWRCIGSGAAYAAALLEYGVDELDELFRVSSALDVFTGRKHDVVEL